MHSSLADIDLWTAFVNGDQASFGALFSRFYPLLFQYGQKITGDKNLLEDAIQEVFLDLWQRKPALPLRSVKAYLLQALKFTLYKSFRGLNSRSGFTQEELPGFDLSAETLLINREENNERMAKVLAALNQLPSRQKEVIYLKLYKGLSYAEVGEVMQLNYQVVRNLLCTAIKSFKKLCAVLVASFILFLF